MESVRICVEKEAIRKSRKMKRREGKIGRKEGQYARIFADGI